MRKVFLLFFLLSLGLDTAQAIRYPHRAIIVIPANRRSQANSIARRWFHLDGNEDIFSTRLSATGQLPATNYIVHTHLLPDVRMRFEEDRDGITGVFYYVINNETGRLVLTNSVPAQAFIGQVWTSSRTLTDLGLQYINTR